jgi:CHAT domain-containing protein
VLERSIPNNNVSEFTEAFEQIFKIELSQRSESAGLLDLFIESQLSDYKKNRERLHFIADSILFQKDFKKLAYKYITLIVKQEEALNGEGSKALIHFLYLEATLHHEFGKREEGALQLEKALQLLEKDKSFNVKQKVEMLYELQFMYLFSDKSNQVLPTLKEAEHLVGQSDFTDDYLKKLIYTELSAYYGNMGSYDKSESYLVKSWAGLRKRDSIDSSPLYPVYLYDFMNFYRKAGLVKKADELIIETERYLSQLKEIPEGRREELAAVYNLYGELFVVSDPMKAVPFYEKALDINKNGKPGFISQYLFNKCKALLYANKLDEARILSHELLEVAKRDTDNKLAFMYAMSGNIHIKLQNPEKAIAEFDHMVNTISQSIDSISLLGDNVKNYEPSFYLHAVNGMYLMMAERLITEFPENKNVQKAVFNLYHIALKQLHNSIDNQKMNEDVRRTYMKVQKGLLDNFEEGITQELPLDEMIQCSEKVKAGFLWSSFKANHEAAFIEDGDLQRKEEGLNEQITLLQKFTDAEIKKKILGLQQEVEQVRYERSLRFPTLRQFEDFDFELISFQNLLKDEEMGLKYELFDQQLWLFKITKTQVEILPISHIDSLEGKINKLYAMLSQPTSDIEVIKSLTTILTDALLPFLLKGFTQLLIVPDSKISSVPFEVLGINGYLINDHTIRYANALSLLDLKKQEIPVHSIGLFAPSYKNLITDLDQLAMRDQDYSLAGAIEEVNLIASIFNSEKYEGEKATKSGFKANAKDYDILHLAMHSKLNSKNSELHSLIFSDSDEDSELFLSELYAMKLKANLAVLSACNTGLRGQNRGNEIPSLNTAFTYAGVPSVVASLWSVPDQATKDIMAEFYLNLKEGGKLNEALRMAKLNYLANTESEKLKHPFYWAPFVAYGNNASYKFVSEDQWNFTKYAILIIIVMVFTAVFLLIKKSL